MALDISLQQNTLDPTKVEMVKRQKKNKVLLYLAFVLLGWSYGSFGKIGMQTVYYVLPLFAISNIWITKQTHEFDIYSGMAIVGVFIWVVWFLSRLYTLNKDINEFNRKLADYYNLTNEERKEAGING